MNYPSVSKTVCVHMHGVTIYRYLFNNYQAITGISRNYALIGCRKVSAGFSTVEQTFI